MIDNEHAREILDTIEAYGDRERNYGRELQKALDENSAVGMLEERNYAATRTLNEVKRILRPFLDDPAGPNGLFDVPDRGPHEYPDSTWPEDLEADDWVNE